MRNGRKIDTSTAIVITSVITNQEIKFLRKKLEKNVTADTI
jgi:hypothetical protein